VLSSLEGSSLLIYCSLFLSVEGYLLCSGSTFAPVLSYTSFGLSTPTYFGSVIVSPCAGGPPFTYYESEDVVFALLVYLPGLVGSTLTVGSFYYYSLSLLPSRIFGLLASTLAGGSFLIYL
jgi:hypothetical protein